MQLITEWKVIDCCNCHMLFAVPKGVDDEYQKTHKTFSCPAGHKQHYTAKTADEKTIESLRATADNRQKEINRLESSLSCKRNLLNRREYQVRYWKGQTTKAKKK